MSKSLDELSSNLRELPGNIEKYLPKIWKMKNIKCLKSKFRETSLHLSDNKIDLIRQKGVYPDD